MKKVILVAATSTVCFLKAYAVNNIVYKFPENIDSCIVNYISKSGLNDTDAFFILCSSSRDTTSLRICNYKTDSKSIMGKILKNTGRYFLYENRCIPVVLDQDLIFSEFVQNTEYDEKGRKGVLRTIFTLSGQQIRFYTTGLKTDILENKYFQQ